MTGKRCHKVFQLRKAAVTKSSTPDTQEGADNQRLAVSLNTLAQMLDAHRSSVRRWLQEAGIRPIVFGRGRNGAIRYKWCDVQQWIDSRGRTE